MNNELKKRIVTASILSLLFAILLGLSASYVWGRWILAAIVFLINGLCCFEFSRLAVARFGKLDQSRKVVKSIFYFVLTILPGAVVFLNLSYFWLIADDQPIVQVLLIPSLSFFAASILGLFYLVCVGRAALAYSESVAKDLFLGIFMLGFCSSTLMAYAIVEGSWRGLLWLVLVVAVNDIAAYFCGKTIGGPKLAPVLSPNKTVSGSVGGLLIGALVGLIAKGLLPLELAWYQALIISLLLVVLAQLGDLCKSYFKRLHDVKDMGSLLPGHGGVLDRVDGMILAGPLMVYLMVIQLL